MQDLELLTLLVVYPGSKCYALAEDIWTVPLPSLAQAVGCGRYSDRTLLLTPSKRSAMQDLELMTLLVVYPGSKCYALAEDVWTVPLPSLGQEKTAW